MSKPLTPRIVTGIQDDFISLFQATQPGKAALDATEMPALNVLASYAVLLCIDWHRQYALIEEWRDQRDDLRESLD